MAYRLRPRLTVCLVEDQAIFLDIERDRYFSLTGSAARAIEALIGGQLISPDQLAHLSRAGLAPRDDNEPGGPIAIPLPASSLVEQGRRRRPSDPDAIPGVAVSAFLAHRRLRRRPLSSILDGVMARRAAISTREVGPPIAAVETYLGARRMIPVAPRCLPDSLALLDWLFRRGLAADLVFGVKLNPFSAHCWLQSGEVVLNDALDTVRLHTPILIV